MNVFCWPTQTDLWKCLKYCKMYDKHFLNFKKYFWDSNKYIFIFLKNHSNETCVFWTSPNCFDWSENDHEFIEFRGQIHKILFRLKTYLGFCSIKFCWITPDISPGQSTFWTALKIVILSFFISRIDLGRELLGDVIRLSVLLLIKEEFRFQKP